MSKTIKTICIIIGLIVTLIIMTILLLPKLVNTDAIKRQITQQVEQYTGQTLIITGDVKFALFPRLSLHTGVISLSQPTGITSKLTPVNRPLLHITSAKIGVELLPLLQGKFELSQIELNQPQIYFIAAKAGSTSLSASSSEKPSNDLSSNSSITTNSTGTSNSSASNNVSALAGIAASGISIINGGLVIEDQVAAVQYRLDQINIEASDLLSRTPTPVKISALASINNNTKAINSSNIESFAISIQTQISHSADLLSTTLQQASINIIETKQSQASRKLTATLNQLNFHQTTQQLDIQALKVGASHGKLSPELSIAALTLPLNDFFGKSSDRDATPIVAFTVAEKNLGLKARGEFSIKDWNTQALIKGHLVSETFAPKEILNFLDGNYKATDESVLEISQFSSDFNGSVHGFALHNINFTLDDSHLRGDASLVNFNDPHYMFDIDLNQINIDHYLPKNNDSTGAANLSKSDGNNAAARLPLVAPTSLFKNIFANGMFRIANLQANGAKLANIVVDVTSNAEAVIIKSKADLYDGNMDAIITFIDEGAVSTLRMENTLRNVSAGPLLRDTQMTEKIAGKVTATTDISFTDNGSQQANAGTILVSVVDGALKGIDIKKILDDVQNNIDSFRGKKVEQKTAVESKTSFAQMHATLILKDNVVTNNDLQIKAPAFRIGGKGKVNLSSQTIDYATSVIIVNTNEGQGGKNRADLKGLTIPVRFYGDLSTPQYQIDFRALLNENIKRELAIKKEELRLKSAQKLGLVKQGNSVNGNNGEASEKGWEQQLKQKALEKLFEKLF
ncbi:MAG: AsmA protein [Pseudohongiellaceae bacterium]|jgi:AsmA protein